MFTQLEVFEDSKVVIRIRKSKKDRSHNGQKKKYKRTNNDLQNIQIKLKTGGEFRCSEAVNQRGTSHAYYNNQKMRKNGDTAQRRNND
jgi:hypothetical protein